MNTLQNTLASLQGSLNKVLTEERERQQAINSRDETIEEWTFRDGVSALEGIPFSLLLHRRPVHHRIYGGA